MRGQEDVSTLMDRFAFAIERRYTQERIYDFARALPLASAKGLSKADHALGIADNFLDVAPLQEDRRQPFRNFVLRAILKRAGEIELACDREAPPQEITRIFKKMAVSVAQDAAQEYQFQRHGVSRVANDNRPRYL